MISQILHKIKKDMYEYKLAILLVCIYLVCMQLLFSTWCPIKAIFHVECPGCGLTHATIYLLKGHFKDAFNANYTIFLWWPLIFLFIIDRYVYKFKKNILLPIFILVCFATILRYILIYIIK